MSSIWLAVGYIGGWILSMRIFGYFWKNRKLAINDCEPWFPENVAKKEYLALLEQTEPEAADKDLMAALLLRAREDVIQVLSMREDKQVLARLVKQGTVGDDIWTQFTLSEKDLESEIMEVINEAEALQKGWGQSILQHASELVMRERAKQTEKEQKAKKEALAREKALKDQRKEQTRALNEKNREARKERERVKAMEDLLKSEALEEKRKSSAPSSSPSSPSSKRK
ncbi:translocation protein S66 [Podila epigama]|nr:translocation protein S66 [Podila epigama]